MAGEQSYIYGLFDPAEQVVHYVGQTTRPRARLSGHCMTWRSTSKELGEWVSGMSLGGRRPCMIFLELCRIDTAEIAEFSWYERVKSTGVTVYNRPVAIRRAHAGRTEKAFKDYFSYTVGAILEPGFHHTLYVPTDSITVRKFSRVLEFVAQITE